MKVFGITLESRKEKNETLKKIIESLHIAREEKDLYLVSLEILSDKDFSLFFEKMMTQVGGGKQKEYTIEPLTSTII